MGGMKGKDGGLEGFNRMIALSLMLHFFFLTILFFSSSLPARRWTFGPVYTVDLVSLPSGYSDKGTSTSLLPEVAAIKTGRQADVLKKRSELAVPPIKRIAPAGREAGEVGRAIEGIRKKVEASSGAQTRASQQGAVETSSAVNAYYQALWARIRAEWALPRGILPSENLETVIDVTVSRSGAVTAISIEKSSGNQYFDQSALRAIRKASPFPPVPEDIRGSSIELGIRFHSEQFR